MMGRGKKKFGTDAGFLKSGAAGGASLSTPPIHGTDHISPVVKNVKKPIVPIAAPIRKDIYRGSGKMLSDSGQTIGAAGVDSSGLSRGERAAIMQAKANAPKGIIRPGNYTPITHRGAFGHRGVGFKKGGRVTGIAKRGFGRALMKGKK